ncbi:hypothetical protein [Halarcobacter ebronensis]|uniref:Glycosyl transferase family 1 domain-containing protein n=1 Tax=Halarcobacter ebronensis TaxID=1462615 RepID=A0A4Q1ALK0_9BACT|nr:hypothetical protein [Halarcobacter ebronensis]QKF83322.1 hypothetical protein AEBR_2871 [Halarcobacter ebronensis]RXK05884.1 hypothetical protein CRV07_07370 [Halarcobacter ebronensis]
MNNEQLPIQTQLSNLIQQDFINVASSYSDNNRLNRDYVLTLIQDVSLLKKYKVSYLHNSDFNETMDILKNQLLNSLYPYDIAFVITIDYLQNSENVDFLQKFFVEIFLKTPKELFIDIFFIFNILCGSVKELYGYFLEYIFNNKFLILDENIQIDCLYKAWNLSLQVYHDNEASQFAYNELKHLFQNALNYQKTEVAFWLYYTPLHYFNAGTHRNKHEANQRFQVEIEKPLEKYIKNHIIPKYKITPNKKKVKDSSKKKVAFVMQRIIRHSTVKVLYYLMESLMKEKQDKYEFILYDLAFPESGGSDVVFIKEFEKLGLKYVNLHEKIFNNKSETYSLLEKCIKSREILIEDNIDILIGLHTRVEYMFFYLTRTAPKQIYWYHNSNDYYDVEGIDIRIAHGSTPNNFKFHVFNLLSNYNNDNDKNLEKEIARIKNSFSKNVIVLGSIGRLIKLDNNEYLETIFEIMEKRLNTVYLVCGAGDSTNIKKQVEKRGLSSRFFFIGFVDPKIYIKVIDIYLNTFPESSGESLNEFISKGGVPVILLPKEHPAMQEIFRNEWDKKYERIFAFSKKDYINLAVNLIDNNVIREKLSEENKNRLLQTSLSVKTFESFIDAINK